MMFDHASVGKTFLGESITAFSLARSLDSPTVVLLDTNVALAIVGDKIRLPISEVLLYAASGDLSRSKKQRYWVPLKSVLLSLLLTEAAILGGETSVEDLLNIFARSITDREVEEEEDDREEDDEESEE